MATIDSMTKTELLTSSKDKRRLQTRAQIIIIIYYYYYYLFYYRCYYQLLLFKSNQVESEKKEIGCGVKVRIIAENTKKGK